MDQTAGEIVARAESDLENGDPGNGRGGQVQGEAIGGGSPQLAEQIYNDSDETNGHLGIYQAAIKGDWKAAKRIYTELGCQLDINDPITSRGETALHIAALAKQAVFVTELVKVMSDDGLRLGDLDGNTALFLAVFTGNMAVVEPMIEKNEDLAMVRNANRMLPLYFAVLLEQQDMVSYLYGRTKYRLRDEDCANLLVALIDADMYDIALDMVKGGRERLATIKDRYGDTALHALARNPRFSTMVKGGRERLATIKDRYKETALHALARNPRFSDMVKGGRRVLGPDARSRCCNPFSCLSSNKTKRKKQHKSARELAEFIWARVALLKDETISNLLGEKEWQPIFVAAAQGNVEFLRILIRTKPDIVRKENEQRKTIFHIAVERRHEKVFELIYEIGSFKNMVARYRDEDSNNLLHLAGKLAPPRRLNVVPGAALQLQRELLWFEEVKKVVGRHLANARNKSHQTPEELFMDEHKILLKEGEEWMRNTANSCMIVATLVATVAFAAAFTVPGGNDQNTGYPMFVNKTLFRIFAVSDAISLVFSVSSVLTFLSILTSTYEMKNFVRSLPTRLLIGIFTLFVSISAMMVAFVSVFFVYFRNQELPRYALPVAVVAFAPICLFVIFHSRLFRDVIMSTYTRSLFHPNYKNPVIPTGKTCKKEA